MKLIKKIVVFNKTDESKDWPPENVVKLIAWINGKMEPIPVEYRDSTRLEVDIKELDDESSQPLIRITYERPETDEEEESRATRRKQIENTEELRERNLLAWLKEKYETNK